MAGKHTLSLTGILLRHAVAVCFEDGADTQCGHTPSACVTNAHLIAWAARLETAVTVQTADPAGHMLEAAQHRSEAPTIAAQARASLACPCVTHGTGKRTALALTAGRRPANCSIRLAGAVSGQQHETGGASAKQLGFNWCDQQMSHNNN